MDWSKLENKLLDYFRAGIADKNRTYAIVSLQIEKMYIDEIKSSGKDKFGNSVLSINTGPLAMSLKTAMEKAFLIKYGAPVILNNIGLAGIVLTWAGGVLGQTKPPPTSVKIVTNLVTSVGSIPTMNIPEQKTNSDENIFIKELIKALKKHADTVAGVCTALVPVGTAQVPKPFPWIGIQ